MVDRRLSTVSLAAVCLALPLPAQGIRLGIAGTDISHVIQFSRILNNASVPDIPTLCARVDAVLLESGDGRIHLSQVKPVIAAHKPEFIDKPVGATLEHMREIDRLAKAAGVPWFSSSRPSLS